MFTDKVIIVTGGSSGMGKAMAKRFADEGAQVIITGRDAERLESARQEIGERAHTYQMDVRNLENVQGMIEFADKKFGKIDGLVNNAAGNFIVHAEELSPNGWKAVIDIVLNGTFYCTSAVGNYWIKNDQKGAILNMLATYAWDAGPGIVHSAAAKAGVMSLTRTLAVEWGRKFGFRVNGIAPGPIERTGGADRLFQSEEAVKRTINSIPLGRVGTPEEIAELAAFIMSDKASYMNGEIVTLDGGQWLNQYPF
jgi:NAD(P)-dependent dehydrogenase (short-subunit alcohol dehydrogenase family)